MNTDKLIVIWWNWYDGRTFVFGPQCLSCVSMTTLAQAKTLSGLKEWKLKMLAWTRFSARPVRHRWKLPGTSRVTSRHQWKLPGMSPSTLCHVTCQPVWRQVDGRRICFLFCVILMRTVANFWTHTHLIRRLSARRKGFGGVLVCQQLFTPTSTKN